jgi:hypothetical protein
MWFKKSTLKLITGIFLFQFTLSAAFAQNGVPSSLENKAKTAADPALGTPAAPTVIGFLEWKSQRVHEAQQKVEQMNKSQNQAQVWQEGKSTTDAQPVAAPAASGDEQKLNFNVDVALQLNIQDYFSMYLKNLTPEEFKEATKKLNSDEVAELLLAYKNSQDKDKKLPLKFSTVPLNNAKSKKSKI